MSDLTWDQVRTACNRAAMEQGEWAGAPIPIEGLRLIVEPRYPFRGLNGMHFGEAQYPKAGDDSARAINSWYSRHHGATVVVWHDGDGRSKVSLIPERENTRCELLLNTLVSSQAWDFMAKLKAWEKLSELIPEHMHRCYLLTGMFIETSQRSRVTYIFRRLRPTLALRPNAHDKLRVIAALCLHPIGHYELSFAGAMVPTDDVIAHLLLMRGDERRFWAKANHHPLYLPSSGL